MHSSSSASVQPNPTSSIELIYACSSPTKPASILYIYPLHCLDQCADLSLFLLAFRVSSQCATASKPHMHLQRCACTFSLPELQLISLFVVGRAKKVTSRRPTPSCLQCTTLTAFLRCLDSQVSLLTLLLRTVRKMMARKMAVRKTTATMAT